MVHRKEVHDSTVKMCVYCILHKNVCKFGGMCWYRHEQQRITPQEDEYTILKCNSCGIRFKTNIDLMRHRKAFHPQTVSRCNNFDQRKCELYDNDCWYNYSHVGKNMIVQDVNHGGSSIIGQCNIANLDKSQNI